MIEYKVIVSPDGTQHWFLNGNLHREDGPAVVWADGTQYWCLNGNLHREDDPAIVWADGTKSWYLNGIELSEKEFNNRHNVELTLEEIAEKFNISVDHLKIKK